MPALSILGGPSPIGEPLQLQSGFERATGVRGSCARGICIPDISPSNFGGIQPCVALPFCPASSRPAHLLVCSQGEQQQQRREANPRLSLEPPAPISPSGRPRRPSLASSTG